MKVTLPNGLLDGQDLFNIAFVDELKGKQQNYLANRDLVVGNIGHLPKILSDCIISLESETGVKWAGKMEDAVEKLSVGDLETLLIKIRHNTYGERFYFEAECPHCQTKNKNLRVDLDKLDLKPMAVAEMLDKSRLTLILPKSKIEVEVKPLFLKDLFESIKIVKNKQDQLVTSVIALSLRKLGDKTKVTAADVEDLPAMDLLFLKDKLEEIRLEGTIDSDIQIDCSNCGKEFSSKLDVFSSDFFDPSKGSTNSPT